MDLNSKFNLYTYIFISKAKHVELLSSKMSFLILTILKKLSVGSRDLSFGGLE